MNWLNTTTDNKLRSHKIPATTSRNYLLGNRHDDTVITRIRIGHTRLTHQHLFKKENPPICETCNTPLTIEHILVSCSKYNNNRITFQISGPIQQILKEDPNQMKRVVDYLKDIQLFNEL